MSASERSVLIQLLATWVIRDIETGKDHQSNALTSSRPILYVRTEASMNIATNKYREPASLKDLQSDMSGVRLTLKQTRRLSSKKT